MLYYIYSGDELLGFIYKDVTYYYHKNIFGDIIGILDFNYNEIVTYTYDTFGVIKSIIDNSNLNLGVINPFRYRSYYYDEETKLYYLNSRYYNPLSSACDKVKAGVSSVKKGITNVVKKELIKLLTYNSVQAAVSNFCNTAVTTVSNFYNRTKDNISNFAASAKESFVFEWGTGVGAKINVSEFIDVGLATTFGSTYNNGEWHEYDCFSTGATIGLTEKYEVGYSRSYTHYEQQGDYHDYFMDVPALITSECSEIGDTTGAVHKKQMQQ